MVGISHVKHLLIKTFHADFLYMWIGLTFLCLIALLKIRLNNNKLLDKTLKNMNVVNEDATKFDYIERTDITVEP